MAAVRIFILLCLVCVGISSARDCTSNKECIYSCANNYHEQCVSGMCQCVDHTCSVTKDCPTGNKSGCPPDMAKCVSGKCQCQMF